MTHSISSWAFDDWADEVPDRDWSGLAFRAHLEKRVTDGALKRHEETDAPPEVLQRRVDGRVVVQRRGGR